MIRLKLSVRVRIKVELVFKVSSITAGILKTGNDGLELGSFRIFKGGKMIIYECGVPDPNHKSRLSRVRLVQFQVAGEPCADPNHRTQPEPEPQH